MEPFYSSERMCCLARKILSARVKTPRVPYAAMLRCGGGGPGGERPRPLQRRPPAGPPEGQDVSCTTHCADTPALSVRFLVEPFYSSKWSESRTQEMFLFFWHHFYFVVSSHHPCDSNLFIDLLQGVPLFWHDFILRPKSKKTCF